MARTLARHVALLSLAFMAALPTVWMQVGPLCPAAAFLLEHTGPLTGTVEYGAVAATGAVALYVPLGLAELATRSVSIPGAELLDHSAVPHLAAVLALAALTAAVFLAQVPVIYTIPALIIGVAWMFTPLTIITAIPVGALICATVMYTPLGYAAHRRGVFA